MNTAEKKELYSKIVDMLRGLKGHTKHPEAILFLTTDGIRATGSVIGCVHGFTQVLQHAAEQDEEIGDAILKVAKRLKKARQQPDIMKELLKRRKPIERPLPGEPFSDYMKRIGETIPEELKGIVDILDKLTGK